MSAEILRFEPRCGHCDKRAGFCHKDLRSAIRGPCCPRCMPEPYTDFVQFLLAARTSPTPNLEQGSGARTCPYCRGALVRRYCSRCDMKFMAEPIAIPEHGTCEHSGTDYIDPVCPNCTPGAA
jgi:hypothetical protein